MDRRIAEIGPLHGARTGFSFLSIQPLNTAMPVRIALLTFSLLLGTAAFAQSPVDPGSPLETLDTEFGLADGPSWDGNGTLYIPDVKGETLSVWSPKERQRTVLLPSAGRISATFYRGGTLYLSDNANARIVTLDNTELNLLCQLDDTAKPAPRPNDLVVDAAGGVYVTITAQNRVAYINAKGEESTAVAAIAAPNGIILSPDGKTLYVSAYAAKQIWAYPVTSAGKTGEAKLLALMDDGPEKGADGMSIDSAGNVYCAGAADVWIWNPEGKLLAKINCPTRPINCTFGDNDLKSLYITGFGGLYRQRMTVAGVSEE